MPITPSTKIVTEHAVAPPSAVRVQPWRRRYRLTGPMIGMCVVSGLVLALSAIQLYTQSPPAFMDLDVYREGVRAWRNGGDMYGPLPATIAGNHLPFIYPPFAVIVLGPLAMLPWPVAAVLMMIISLVSLTAVIFLTVRHVWPNGGPRGAALVTAVIAPLSLLLQPVWDTLWFGQVNLLLMALVALDCLVAKPTWPRGLLIGIAAATKLTPAVFVLYFLLRKDYRAALIATVTGLVAVGIGFLVSWTGSLTYWFGSAGGARSISGSLYATNQTIDAFFARLNLGHSGLTAWWLSGTAVLFLVALLAVRRAQVIGTAPLALSATACFGLLASPTSWGHHWVYVVPGLIAMTGQTIRERSAGWATAVLCVAAVFYTAPFRQVPAGEQRELRWTWLQQIPGNSYTITGIALLAALAAPALLTIRQRRGARGCAVIQRRDPEAAPK
jgi:alpha-1,2-mannosyltransferase